MRKLLVLSSLALSLWSVALAPTVATATPSIAVYFDRALTQQYAECPYLGALDTVFVAVSGFSSTIEGVEYRIVFPPELLWIANLSPAPGLEIGDPVNGQTLALFAPLEASDRVIVREVLVLWQCEGCATVNIPIEFAANPQSGALRAVTSDLTFEDLTGQSSWICPTVAQNVATPSQTARVAPAAKVLEQCVLDCPRGDGGVILPGDPPGQHHTPDLDGDGLVSIVDFEAFWNAYVYSFDSDMDYYCSGALDLVDFVLFTRHWYHSVSVRVEPSTWGRIKAQYTD